MKLLDDALKYCKDVIDGIEITTDEVKQQCKKFLHDYEIKQYEDKFEFFYVQKS